MNLEDPRAVRLRAVLRLVYPHHRGYSAQDARRPAAGGRGGDDFRHRAGNLYGAAYVEKIASSGIHERTAGWNEAQENQRGPGPSVDRRYASAHRIHRVCVPGVLL